MLAYLVCFGVFAYLAFESVLPVRDIAMPLLLGKAKTDEYGVLVNFYKNLAVLMLSTKSFLFGKKPLSV